MGLLTKGHPLSWAETVPHVQYIKEHGIAQGRKDDQLKWGDEIEYTVVKFDDAEKRVRVALRADPLLSRLGAREELNALVGAANEFLWRPEFASYMVEGTPGTPYGGLLACFNVVESNMRARRARVEQLLGEGESLMSISFPALGTPDFTFPPTQPTPNDEESAGRSLYFPDAVVYRGHPRFENLVRNIRGRRGEKVAIYVPMFRDENTPETFEDDPATAAGMAKPYEIHMDHMGFGMGCCCLQVTFQASSVDEARWLYDQLTPITPIVLALSAATPVVRGYLSDMDSRWDIISASVDDRTYGERGLAPLEEGRFRIQKSRYDSTDCYIYPCSATYNDIPLQYDEKIYQQLRDGDVDEHLAKHIAHMFIRDPLQVFRERIQQDDNKSSEHFETIQSSNWMNMRFKPPPPDAPEIGWRVEFRPSEVQLTDFENAAYCCFVVLLTRVIISFRITCLLPISLVTENMKRAQRRDAVLHEKFYFRKGLSTCRSPPDSNGRCATECTSRNAAPTADIELMTVNEIINGQQGNDEFPGLVPLIRQYLDSADVDVDTRCTISQYLNFISAGRTPNDQNLRDEFQKRASGEIWTLAHWMRDFVAVHPDYKKDSRVPSSTLYDMLRKMESISVGREHDARLLGSFRSKTDAHIPAAVLRAEESLIMNKHSKPH